MVIYVDIDDTICTHTDGFYEEAVPFDERIQKINQLYKNGHTIIYWTARGSKTGLDWHSLTKQQLAAWGAEYHELVMGKPYYDILIDDRTFNTIDEAFYAVHSGNGK